MIKPWIAMPFVVALTGCVMGAARDFALEPGSSEGLVVISTRGEDACHPGSTLSSAAVMLVSEADGSRVPLLLKNMWVKPDFENPPGYLYVKSLPQGRYFLGKANYSSTRAGLSSKRDLDIPFTVEAGKAYYLGELTISFLPNCGDLKVTVRNQRERDLDLFAKRMKNVRPDQVVDQILLKNR